MPLYILLEEAQLLPDVVFPSFLISSHHKPAYEQRMLENPNYQSFQHWAARFFMLLHMPIHNISDLCSNYNGKQFSEVWKTSNVLLTLDYGLRLLVWRSTAGTVNFITGRFLTIPRPSKIAFKLSLEKLHYPMRLSQWHMNGKPDESSSFHT